MYFGNGEGNGEGRGEKERDWVRLGNKREREIQFRYNEGVRAAMGQSCILQQVMERRDGAC